MSENFFAVKESDGTQEIGARSVVWEERLRRSKAAALLPHSKKEGHAAACPGKTRDLVSRLDFFFYVDFDFGGYVAEDFDGDREFADGLDGFGELHLALVHFEALRLKGLGDIAGGDGTEHLVVLAGLAVELDGDTAEQLGLLFGSIEFGGGFLGQRAANALERLHVARRGFDADFVGQQEIAGVAGLDGDNVAAVAEFFYVFLKNDLHDSLLNCFENRYC